MIWIWIIGGIAAFWYIVYKATQLKRENDGIMETEWRKRNDL